VFLKDSRYDRVDPETYLDDRHREIRYKKVRIIPERRAVYAHKVREGERLDHIAFRYFKAPDKYWLICDANLTMWPDDLTIEKDRIILIPGSE